MKFLSLTVNVAVTASILFSSECFQNSVILPLKCHMLRSLEDKNVRLFTECSDLIKQSCIDARDSTHTDDLIVAVSSPSAPNLKGRPRKKKPSISQRRDSQSQAQGQGSSGLTQGSTAEAAQDPCSPESKTTTKVR